VKKITIHIDGDDVKIDQNGYEGISCLTELEALNLPYDKVTDSVKPNKGVLDGQAQARAH